jgi:hypothetical protein
MILRRRRGDRLRDARRWVDTAVSYGIRFSSSFNKKSCVLRRDERSRDAQRRVASVDTARNTSLAAMHDSVSESTIQRVNIRPLKEINEQGYYNA